MGHKILLGDAPSSYSIFKISDQLLIKPIIPLTETDHIIQFHHTVFVNASFLVWPQNYINAQYCKFIGTTRFFHHPDAIPDRTRPASMTMVDCQSEKIVRNNCIVVVDI